jgi:O-acetyl-ADP-ribose deacetylase (regulator of RNase III)
VIQVVVDDLALIQADAILRPADENLSPVSETISRLDERAGPRFAEQRRLSAPLKAGAAVVTGSGELTAPFVLHVIVQDPDSRAGRDVIRRGLVSAWERARDWELGVIATPLVGVGHLTAQESAGLLVETFPTEPGGCPFELRIVVEQDAERELVESIVRRSG